MSIPDSKLAIKIPTEPERQDVLDSIVLTSGLSTGTRVPPGTVMMPCKGFKEGF